MTVPGYSGALQTPEQFAAITVLKATPTVPVVLGDVARVELVRRPMPSPVLRTDNPVRRWPCNWPWRHRGAHCRACAAGRAVPPCPAGSATPCPSTPPLRADLHRAGGCARNRRRRWCWCSGHARSCRTSAYADPRDSRTISSALHPRDAGARSDQRVDHVRYEAGDRHARDDAIVVVENVERLMVGAPVAPGGRISPGRLAEGDHWRGGRHHPVLDRRVHSDGLASGLVGVIYRQFSRPWQSPSCSRPSWRSA